MKYERVVHYNPNNHHQCFRARITISEQPITRYTVPIDKTKLWIQYQSNTCAIFCDMKLEYITNSPYVKIRPTSGITCIHLCCVYVIQVRKWQGMLSEERFNIPRLKMPYVSMYH